MTQKVLTSLILPTRTNHRIETISKPFCTRTAIAKVRYYRNNMGMQYGLIPKYFIYFYETNLKQVVKDFEALISHLSQTNKV